MCRKLFSVLKHVVAVSVVLLTSTVAFAHESETHPEADDGAKLQAALHWLQTAQRVDGHIVSATDIANDRQATAEALAALRDYESASIDRTAALGALRANAEVLTTEQLARLLIVLVDAGQSYADEITEMMARRREDGGFAHLPGYDSAVLDTAYALLALQAANADAVVAGHAVGFLSSAQLPSGAFGLYGDQPSILATALAVKALKPYLYTYNIASLLSRAVDVLYASQDSAGGWNSDWESALVLQALVPITTDVTRYKPAVDALAAAQSVDGDWAQQVYTTSLALSALTLLVSIDVPADPEKAVVTGRLVDANNGTGISGSSIDLMTGIGGSVTLDDNGSFVIANLDAGAYTFAYSAPGYLGASQSLTLQKGQFVNVGTIRLSIAPSAVLIQGALTDSQSGLAIAGAIVTVAVAGSSSSTTTDQYGRYQLLAEIGEATLSVSTDDYYGVSASAELLAGTTVNFSPSLIPLSSTQPSASSLRGTVVDEESTPIEAAAIRLVESGDVSQTDANGQFTFSGLTGGSAVIELQKAGFESLRLELVIPKKAAVDVGRIALREQVILPSTSLTGRIIDMSSGDGVPGASVVTSGRSTTTDNNGYYHLSGIEVLEFIVSVNASGYLFTDKQITLNEHAHVSLDIHIRQADLGGVEVSRVSTDKSTYAAYEPVLITADLLNDTALTQGARLYVQVKDADGNEVANFSGVQLPLLDPQSDPEELAHYQEHLDAAIEELSPSEQRSVPLEQWWNTLIVEPGTYIVTVHALDATTSNLVSEKSTTIQVEETRALASLNASVSPGYVLLHRQADVDLAALLHNRSNVPIEFEFNYALKNPAGNVLARGSRDIALQPGQTNQQLLLTTLTHTFSVSGDYTLELDNISGASVDQVSSGVVFVPPTIRLDATQSLSPYDVVPLEGISVDSRIQVKGVDGE